LIPSHHIFRAPPARGVTVLRGLLQGRLARKFIAEGQHYLNARLPVLRQHAANHLPEMFFPRLLFPSFPSFDCVRSRSKPFGKVAMR
jgi:hypothetical protein